MLFGSACVLWLLATPLALLLAMLSPVLADNPANRNEPHLKLVMTLLFTWPVATVLAPIAGAVAYRKAYRKLAWGLIASPLIWVAAVFLAGSPFHAR